MTGQLLYRIINQLNRDMSIDTGIKMWEMVQDLAQKDPAKRKPKDDQLLLWRLSKDRSPPSVTRPFREAICNVPEGNSLVPRELAASHSQQGNGIRARTQDVLASANTRFTTCLGESYQERKHCPWRNAGQPCLLFATGEATQRFLTEETRNKAMGLRKIKMDGISQDELKLLGCNGPKEKKPVKPEILAKDYLSALWEGKLSMRSLSMDAGRGGIILPHPPISLAPQILKVIGENRIMQLLGGEGYDNIFDQSPFYLNPDELFQLQGDYVAGLYDNGYLRHLFPGDDWEQKNRKTMYDLHTGSAGIPEEIFGFNGRDYRYPECLLYELNKFNTDGQNTDFWIPVYKSPSLIANLINTSIGVITGNNDSDLPTY
jgi:hypothetical protein